MKVAIINILCGENGGFDIGGFHDMIQFIPAYRKEIKMNELVLKKQYLRRRGGTWDFSEGSSARMWPDIVDYIHSFTLTSEVTAIGPADVKYYFNC